MPKPKRFVCNKLKWKRYGTNIYMISNSLPECLSSQLPIWRSAQQQNQPCKKQNQSPSFHSLLWVALFFWGGGGGGRFTINVYSEEHLLFVTVHSWTLYCPYLLTFSLWVQPQSSYCMTLALLVCRTLAMVHCTYFSYHWCKICNFVHQLTQITQSAWPLIHWNQETTAG